MKRKNHRRKVSYLAVAKVLSTFVSLLIDCFVKITVCTCCWTYMYMYMYMWVVPCCRLVYAAGRYGSAAAGRAAEESGQAGSDWEGCVRAGDGEEKHPLCHEIQRARERWARPSKLRLTVLIWNPISQLLFWSPWWPHRSVWHHIQLMFACRKITLQYDFSEVDIWDAFSM